MQPANSPPISGIISQLQREKAELTRQLQNSLKDNSILTKEIQQWKKEHGSLQMSLHVSNQELTQLRNQCQLLTHRLTQLPIIEQERDVFESKLRNSEKDVEILKKQCGNLRSENGELLGRVALLETEIRVLKGEKTKLEEEKAEVMKREKEGRVMCEKLEEDLVRVERCKKEEIERIIKEKKKVEGKYEAVMMAATDKYKELELRVRDLEEIVEKISSDSSDAVQPNAEAEQQQNEGLVECPSVFEAIVHGSAPCTQKSVPTPPPVFEITDSDEEDLPFLEGTKRKLIFSPGCSDEKEESANSGTNRSKQLKTSGDGSVNASMESMPLTSKPTQNPVALKQCENKSGVELAGKHQGLSAGSVVNDCKDGTQEESGYSNNWEYEADLLDALGRDTELCMKAVCALYRQQTADRRSISGPVSGYKGFNLHSTLRIAVLAKILTNGDEQGRLRRSVTELEGLNPPAIVECRTIAFAHAAQLFEIYQKKADPFWP